MLSVSYVALIHVCISNVYIHMYSFIVVSCPLARVQVVIYIYDISWLTVISFVLHT